MSSKSSKSESRERLTFKKEKNYKKFFFAEIELASSVPVEQDNASQTAKLKELKEKLSSCYGFKKKKDKVSEDLRIKTCFSILELRRLNRLMHYRIKTCREDTSEAKKKIDHRHLQLQNLLYEVQHLQKEISRCIRFRSGSDDLSLVTLEKFRHEAPESIQCSISATTGDHGLMKSRLHWELEQRKELCNRLKALDARRSELKKSIDAKRGSLDSLHPKLDSVLKASLPVQEFLNMQYSRRVAFHQMSVHLPDPLFSVYQQFDCHAQESKDGISISIEGNEADVKLWNEKHPVDQTDINDLDGLDDETETKHQSKRRRLSQSAKASKAKRSMLLTTHPIRVSVDLSGPVSVTLLFEHLTYLSVVSLKICCKSSLLDSTAFGEILAPRNILTGLFSETQSVTLQPRAKEKLKAVGISDWNAISSEAGFLYDWVNRLAGSLTTNSARGESYHIHVSDIVSRIKSRLKARQDLIVLLSKFAKGDVPLELVDSRLFPEKIRSHLQSWKKISLENFLSFSSKHSEFLHAYNFFYEAQITHNDTGNMKLCIALHPNYPHMPALFAIAVSASGISYANDRFPISAIECELNCKDSAAFSCGNYDQLTSKLLQACLCLDIFLETGGTMETLTKAKPLTYSRAMYPRVFRGPDRLLPFIFNNNVGIFHHVSAYETEERLSH